MQRHHKPGVRAVATLSVLGLALGVAAAIPGSSALAGSPTGLLDQALAGPTSATSDALDPGIVAELPRDMTFRLSPELAAAYGVATLNADQAKTLFAQRGKAALPGQTGAPTPEIGTKRMWPALDMTPNTSTAIPPFGIYLKEYKLTAKKPNVEIWVASGTDAISTGTQFPAGDCRVTRADPTVVTAAQAEGLANEFQNKMLPVESKFFSVAPAADGTLSPGQLGPLGVDFTGSGDSTVTLVDNVRDPNFYDFVNNRTYIAGFFAPIFNQITNRNVMTIDAFDWIHRTGDNPKNEPNDDICQSRPARARTYESVFAHEYQHLLQSYVNPNPLPINSPIQFPGVNESEELWVNEGLSDMAPFLVGYSNATRNVHQAKAESHLFCFQGYGEVKGPANPNPNYCGGPENSLTLWEDQGGNSDILSDYGNAWSFMIFLYDRYGAELISALHRDPAVGLGGLQGLLDKFGGGTKALDVIHDYQLMNLLDNAVSAKGAKLVGANRAAISSKELKAAVNYTYRGAFEKPGAAPNGADYVVLRQGGKILSGKALRSLVFSGAPEFEGNKVENWFVRLVGIDAKGKRYLVRTFDNAASLNLSAGDLKQFASYSRVVAVIGVDDLAEAHQTFVPYSMTVNGDKQLGGA